MRESIIISNKSKGRRKRCTAKALIYISMCFEKGEDAGKNISSCKDEPALSPHLSSKKPSPFEIAAMKNSH